VFEAASGATPFTSTLSPGGGSRQSVSEKRRENHAHLTAGTSFTNCFVLDDVVSSSNPPLDSPLRVNSSFDFYAVSISFSWFNLKLRFRDIECLEKAE